MKTVTNMEEETVIDNGIKTADEFLFLYYILLGRYQQTWWLRGDDHVDLKKVVDYVTNMTPSLFFLSILRFLTHIQSCSSELLV